MGTRRFLGAAPSARGSKEIAKSSGRGLRDKEERGRSARFGAGVKDRLLAAAIDTTARRGSAREQRKTSRACRGNCGDFVDTFVTAYGRTQRKGGRRVHPGPQRT